MAFPCAPPYSVEHEVDPTAMLLDPPARASDTLIVRLLADDERALEDAMRAYLSDVVAIAFSYVRTRDVAADVAQDVFIKTWARRHTLDPSGNLLHYLRRAARNTALHVLERDAASARFERSLTQEYTVLRSHDENTGLTTLEAEEFNQQVRDVLGGLSPRVREIAILYHERAMEPGEIAAMLDVAPQTVYNQLGKAMKVLAQAFRSSRGR
jgi:RNA polymerase sigma factor (sigma-70 family)